MPDNTYKGASKNISNKGNGESSLEKELYEKSKENEKKTKENSETGDRESESSEKVNKETKEEVKEPEIREKESSEKEVRVDENFNKEDGFKWKERGFSFGWSLNLGGIQDMGEDPGNQEEKRNRRINMARNLEENLEGIIPFNQKERDNKNRYSGFETGYDAKMYNERNYDNRRREEEFSNNYSTRQGTSQENMAFRREFEDSRLDPGIRKDSSLERDYVMNNEARQSEIEKSPINKIGLDNSDKPKRNYWIR